MTPAVDLAACAATAWQLAPDLPLRVAVAGGLVLLARWSAAQRFFAGQRSFTVLLLVMVGWLITTTLGHAAVDPHCKSMMSLLAWPVILAQPVLWALFLHQYVGTRDELPPAPRVLAVALPYLLLSLAALSNGHHGLLYGPGSALGPPELGLPRMHYQRGPLFVALALWGYAWLGLSLGTLARAWREAATGERRQWGVFLAIMAVPVGTNLAYVLAGWRPLGGDPTPLSYGAALGGFAWMIRRGQLFTAVPMARRLLFAELPDPVLVLDPQGRVRDANRAAEQLAGTPPPPGCELRDWPVFGAALADALAQDRPPALPLGQPPRSFELRVRELGSGERLLGRLVQLRDVTELRELALRDALTGLYNRRALEQRFEAEAGRPLTLVLVDIDHFKRINDSAGHAAGDAVLRAVAQLLQDGVRDGDGVFRIGGEEFALLLPRADAASAQRRAEGLRAALAAQALPQAPGPVTLSAGIAEWGRHGSSLTALLGAADGALYAAKQAGRNRVAIAA